MKYYVVTNSLFDDSLYAFGEYKERPQKRGPAKKCKCCNSYISLLEWLPPFEINLTKKELGDFIFGQYVGFIISKRVRDKILETKQKGISDFRKVKLFYKGNEINIDYYYPSIDIIKAFIDYKYVHLEDKCLCKVCQKGKSIINKIDKIVFENPKEISKDIFFTTSIGQSTIIMSENFINILKNENYTNIKFVDSNIFKWDSLN